MLIPAIDLKGGKVVQLIQGEKLAIETTDLDHWIERFSGFRRVNVIDLDAAMGSGSNDHLVREICARLPCQVGGGVRTPGRAVELCAIGARKVIIGSALFKDGIADVASAQRFSDAVGVEFRDEPFPLRVGAMEVDRAPERRGGPDIGVGAIGVGEVRQELVDAVGRNEWVEVVRLADGVRGIPAVHRRFLRHAAPHPFDVAVGARPGPHLALRAAVDQRGVDGGVGGGDPFEQFGPGRALGLRQRPDPLGVGDVLLDDARPEVPHLADVPGEVAEVPTGAGGDGGGRRVTLDDVEEPDSVVADQLQRVVGEWHRRNVPATSVAIHMSDLSFTHLDPLGRARMVDVTPKEPTHRRAVARCKVFMQPETTAAIANREVKKGDVLSVNFEIGDDFVAIEAQVDTVDRTGVEMEALHACSVAALTVYDMCKSADRAMVIGELALWEKTGGRSGVFRRE